MTNLSAAKLRRLEARESRSRSISPQLLASTHETDRASSTAEHTAALTDTSHTKSSKQADSIRLENVNDIFSLITPPLTPPPSRRQLKNYTSSSIQDSLQMSSFRPVRLLITSLGNPAPYTNTRHSAGHTVLKSLASTLQFPLLSKSKLYNGGSVSSGSDVGQPEYTLYQSPSLMNVSGVNVLKAWKQFTSLYPSSPTQTSDPDTPITGLVVLHDELELPTGQLKLRRGQGSARGHNGLKSIQTSFSSGAIIESLGNRFIKIGVGIGRPMSRDKADVSGYVLAEMTGSEKKKIENSAEQLVGFLRGEVEKLGKLR